MKVILGDFSAQVGTDNTEWEETMGKEAFGERNDNGERFLSYCSGNQFKVGCSLLQHKKIQIGTWRSPNGKTVNQIDHICYQRGWASLFQDVRVYTGADIDSDHYMVVATLKVKLESLTRRNKHTILDTAKLKRQRTIDQFCIKLKNRFLVLNREEYENVEEDWKEINDTIINTAKDIVRFRRGSKKEMWITKGTWMAIHERRTLKAKKGQAFRTGTSIEHCIGDY